MGMPRLRYGKSPRRRNSRANFCLRGGVHTSNDRAKCSVGGGGIGVAVGGGGCGGCCGCGGGGGNGGGGIISYLYKTRLQLRLT